MLGHTLAYPCSNDRSKARISRRKDTRIAGVVMQGVGGLLYDFIQVIKQAHEFVHTVPYGRTYGTVWKVQKSGPNRKFSGASVRIVIDIVWFSHAQQHRREYKPYNGLRRRTPPKPLTRPIKAHIGPFKVKGGTMRII